MALIFQFVQVLGAGSLALSERPKLKEIKILPTVGCDSIITVLKAQKEQAHKIGEVVKSLGMNWYWLKVQNAKEITILEKREYQLAIEKVFNAIMAYENILVHCSAGLHRTGILAYAVLRKGNLSHNTALDTIAKIRPETAKALEPKYIEIANTLY